MNMMEQIMQDMHRQGQQDQEDMSGTADTTIHGCGCAVSNEVKQDRISAGKARFANMMQEIMNQQAQGRQQAGRQAGMQNEHPPELPQTQSGITGNAQGQRRNLMQEIMAGIR